MKQLLIWIFLSTTLLIGINKVARTQTTETFESVASGVSSFTSNGVQFTLHPSGKFAIDNMPGYGFGSSNRFVDNYGIANTSFQIKSTTTFTVKSLYLYPSANVEGSSNQTVGVSVTFTGKLAGATKFTYNPPASDFTAASYENTSNRGFSLVNFATPGYSNITIDELEIALGGSAIYCGVDNFTWGGISSNNSPTNISLSTSSINENVAANATVGTLSTTDPNSGNTFTYTLVSGAGDTDNASFNISGSNLRISISPDYETKSSYSIRVRTTDQGGLTYEKAFSILINDLSEVTPPRIAGDLNGDGKITAPEIAGDVNGNRIIDSTEKTGDTNGDGKIALPELLGDSNGNGIIDNGEISGFDLPENDEKLNACVLRNTEIRIAGEVTGKAVATLIDIQGRTILIKNLEAGNINHVPIPAIKTGIYILCVNENDRKQMIRLSVSD